MIEVIMVDDHPIITEGFSRWAEAIADIELTAAATSLTQLPDLLEAHSPDVIVVDFRMPGMRGVVSLTEFVRQGHALVVFSSLDDESVISAMQQAGIRAFVSKSESIKALLDVIRRVDRGEYVFPAATGEIELPHELLSERELLVFEQLIEGNTPKEIAYNLGIATSSVYTYSERVRRKIGAQSAQELLQYAYDVGLLAPESS